MGGDTENNFEAPSETQSERWRVHKFGGTSVKTAERYRNVARIVLFESMEGERNIVVVSAMGGATDAFVRMIEDAKVGKHQAPLDDVTTRYRETARDLLGAESQLFKEYVEQLQAEADDLSQVLRAISVSRTASSELWDFVTGHGEIWSARILASYMKTLPESTGKVDWLDARKFLTVTKHTDSGAMVDFDASTTLLREALEGLRHCSYIVVTGFVARTHDGVAATLKRNGSDHSASICARLVNAKSCTIWTDVDGIYSADPRLVPDAMMLSELSYQEAMELAFWGSKVVHPHTMTPCLDKGIPIYLRNSLNSSCPGTRIFSRDRLTRRHSPPPPGVLRPTVIKGFSAIDKVSLINLEGAGMIGVPGIASRVFRTVFEAGVSVILITQASSEHSICFCVSADGGRRAKEAVEEEFFREISVGAIQKVELMEDMCILAAVGDRLIFEPSVGGKFFGALAAAKINVVAIAQGSSERNISVVVRNKDSRKALHAVHSSFFVAQETFAVGILGMGPTAEALAQRIESERDNLLNQFLIDVRVLAMSGGSKTVHATQANRPLSLKDWKATVAADGSVSSAPSTEAANEVVNTLLQYHLPKTVIVDASKSADLVTEYATWLQRGVHVITPNTKALSELLPMFSHLRSAAMDNNARFLYSAAVGGSMPWIRTLKDLTHTGDRVTRIEGLLSSTMNVIFDALCPIQAAYTGELDTNMTFSSAIQAAISQGVAEPDVNDDLSGLEICNKLRVLANEIGFYLEECNVSRECFSTESSDESIRAIIEEAIKEKKVVRYVASADFGTLPATARVSLEKLPCDHPFARCLNSDMVLSVTTQRLPTPLTIQGPGVGPVSQASGLFADMLRIAPDRLAHINLDTSES